ncbi:hypothetical protein Sru01_16230 [Sphaerisporangium rufum]|uniref:Uncharacterized protein n=1 Tax=Sphaerisporangium rufum TaxID=1381558 RepID=A0A919QYV7_9ACTN|nr:hypothetical protein [Sphaerisporangium rufum]GII76641.1 hypothetical protein Sru01_16230 [Sphaerisporangium rufum]
MLRAADDLPPGLLSAPLGGLWISKPPHLLLLAAEEKSNVFASCVPMRRFEVCEDGAVADIYEVRPRTR